MADPMNQSSQISSSQGLNDGHSASSKDSKFSDSFFSSPVSLIQSPQDKRVVLGSDKPSENLATSLRFSSQSSSFSPVAYGIDSSPGDNIDHTIKEKRELFESSFGFQKQDSPIKTSPVSERIKALEALAAKQNDFDRNDGGFPHFKERHYEKSPTESHGISSRLSFQKRTISNEQESSELPFQKRKMSSERESSESPFQKRTMANEQESPQSLFQKRTMSNEQESPESPFEKTTMSNEQKFPETPFEKTTMSNKQKSPESPFEKTTMSNEQKSPESPFEKTTMSNEQKSPESPFEKTTMSNEQKSPESTFEKTTMSNEQKSPESTFEKTTMSNEQKSPESPFEKTTMSNEQKSPESTFEKTTMSNEQKSPESTFEKTTMSNEQKSPESPFEETTMSNEQKSPESPFEKTTMSNEQKSPESPFEKTTMSNEQKSPESPFEKTTMSNEQKSPESPFEKTTMSNEQKSPESPFQKRTMSNEQESPESPFEVLGEEKHGSDFEDTADWMRAHLPPAPDFNIEDPDLDEGNDSPVVQESPSKVMIPNSVDTTEVPETFAGVPDQFMDSPIKVADDINQSNDDDNKQSKQECVEDDSEFDLNFLPTAYMWDKQEKANMGTQGYQIFPDSQELPSSPAAPADFESPSPPASQQIEPNSAQRSNILKGNLEPAEIQEIDSSGESDDTVIEETMSIPTVGNNGLDTKTHKEEETVPNNEKQPIQVPIINVIETEEQVLSDDEEPLEVEGEVEEEDEECQILQGEGKRSSDLHDSEVPEKVSVETLHDEHKPDHGISSQTNQTSSESEQSPEHKVIEDDYESGIFLQSSPDSGGLNLEDSQELMSQNLVSFEPLKESSLDKDKTAEILSDLPPDISSPSNEPSDVETYLDHYASEELALKDQLNSSYFKESKDEKIELPKTSCLPDNKNVQESFEHITDDFNETLNECMLDNESVPEPSLSVLSSDIPADIKITFPQNKMPSIDSEDQKSAVEIKDSTLQEQEELPVQAIDQQPPVQENPPTPFHSFYNEQSSKILNDISGPMANEVTDGSVVTKSEPRVVTTEDLSDRPDSPETLSDSETIEAECSVTAATDSFVEFMRECLKSRQDEEPEVLSPGRKTIDQNPKSDASASTQSSPAMIMDFEQECLTISALKELGSSQEEEDKNISTMKNVLKPDKAPNPTPSAEVSVTLSSHTLQNEYHPDALLPKEVEAIDIWVEEAYHLAEHVLTAILTHLTVIDLVHWRDPKKSGVVFGVSLLLLLSLAAFSVISVVSYLLLALLCVTISFRIYKSVIQAVQKSNEGHPFKALMEKDVTVPPETFRKHVDVCLTHVNRALKQMSRLFLVEDLVDSLKLAVVMWLMTYVGAVFNGITILILADIMLFSVPPIYQKNKTQIDHYIDIARTQVNTTIAKLQEKLPGSLKRCKAE
ncbi:reticulon-3-like isoform X1 [Carassius carassius]|uniref:reticulon-3-like isoform X1 n=1 Tax=Carassius carassius TaxID=217509 RepID=UPI002869179C|nr:reticulon-3-like isoform X1 [Carassius carassius]